MGGKRKRAIAEKAGSATMTVQILDNCGAEE
jgi:hypothetical protein